MSIFAHEGRVVVDIERHGYHPDQAAEFVEDLRIAISMARGQMHDIRLGAGPIPPLSQGGTAVLEAEAAVERGPELTVDVKPKARKRASKKGKKA